MLRAALKAITLLLASLFGSVGWGEECSVLRAPTHTLRRAVIAPVVAAGQDTFALTLLATLEYSTGDGMAFGDTDHDGANELAFTGGSPLTYRIWEHQGGNEYSLEAVGPSHLYLFAMGDLDQDGRSEIIGQVSGYVQVFESLDSSSHPSELVWSSPYLSNTLGYASIGDTDRDGRMEIIHSINGIGSTSGLTIFESTGENAFDRVFDATIVGPSATGEKLIADLDGDGLLEIALCGSPGWLHVFESPCDNTWVLTARLGTGMWNAYTVVGGRDTDGNGKPEILVSGTVFTDSTANHTAVIYESSGGDTFARIATLVMDAGVGSASSVVCNADGFGPVEYLVRPAGPGIRVYRASAPGRWDLVGRAYGPGGGIHAFDLNQNGVPEVIWEYSTARIFEHPATPGDADSGLAMNGLEVVPNPCRALARLRVGSGAQAATTLAVLDVRGRIVARLRVEPAARSIPWQPAGDLPAGVYFLLLEDRRGGVVARGKGTIVR